MKKYYVGINGTNVICNGEYFDGYITAYPLGEEGNISYFDRVDKTQKLSQYDFGEWAKGIMLEILKKNPDARFTFFNKKMAEICGFLAPENIEGHNSWELLSFLNNKFKIRQHLSSKIKMLDYLYLRGDELDYLKLMKSFGSSKFVIQSPTGQGGLTTHSIESEKDFISLQLSSEEEYSVSAYEDNLPINSTLMIAKNNCFSLPTSVQLIKNNGNFIYSGGDFVMPKSFIPIVQEQIDTYNNIIGKELQSLGYRGICGVDYIICQDGTVKFMEINPRYQGSSFLLSLAMERAKTSIARLNAECFESDYVACPEIELNKSFVNCTHGSDYLNLGEPDEIIKKVDGATFRKIFNKSICREDQFERPEDLSFICM